MNDPEWAWRSGLILGRVFASFCGLGTDAVAGSEPVSFDWPVTICFIAARMVFRRFRRMHNFL